MSIFDEFLGDPKVGPKSIKSGTVAANGPPGGGDRTMTLIIFKGSTYAGLTWTKTRGAG